MAEGPRVGVDTGGTFTDFSVQDTETGRIVTYKVPSTPRNPANAIINGLKKLRDYGYEPSAVSYFSHGTTVCTNALLEMKAAKTGLILTKGFSGSYHIGFQTRPFSELFDAYYVRPAAIVAGQNIGEVSERVAVDGSVVTAPDVDALRLEVRRLLENGVESIAVCLLFSFLQPAHEQLVRDVIKSESDRIFVSISSDVLPKIREWVRMSTTIVEAYLVPVLSLYLESLGKQLVELGIPKPPFIMQSNGGIMSLQVAQKSAATTLLSGPAAGIVAANYLAKQAGFDHIVTIDVGGTSTDVACMVDNQIAVSDENEIAGRAVGLPMMDIHTLGAGGGSLAWIDAAGRLNVGPRSAGADPGPVCYGMGGVEPTLTDADVVLGFLNPDNFAGGALRLNRDAAYQAIANLGARLGLGPIHAALGITQIATAHMEKGIRLVSLDRGRDPREFALMAFGGAGPARAGKLAQDLEIRKVIVPLSPGNTCSFGLLVSDVRRLWVRSRLTSLTEMPVGQILAQFEVIEQNGRNELVGDGFTAEQIRFNRYLDLRYAGQGYELTVAAENLVTEGDKPAVAARFHDRHAEVYGHRADSEPVDIVNYRVEAVVPIPKPGAVPAQISQRKLAADSHRPVFFEAESAVECPIFRRDALRAGDVIDGPAIVEEAGSTTVVYPGHHVDVDGFLNLIITIPSNTYEREGRSQ